MTTDRAARVAATLEATAVDIVHSYAATRRQLIAWAAGFPASVIGASAPTGGSTSDEEHVELTAVESLASAGAGSVPNLDKLDAQLSWVADQGRKMWADHDEAAIPEPAGTDAARLAVMMWAVRRVQRVPSAISVGRIERYLRSVQRLADHCHQWGPPQQVRLEDQCHAHASARSSELIDPRYRRWQLCRWCGDFRTLHGVTPPPSLVRDHDRGIKMSAVRLQRAGVKIIA